MSGNYLFVNGHMMTGELNQPPVSAVAVREGRIVAVGSDS